MRIAVLTRRYGYNFGSSLQACAMRLMLESLGHQVIILNYDEFSQHLAWKVKPMLRSLAIPCLNVCYKLGIITHMVEASMMEKCQKANFDEFDKRHIKPTKTVFHTQRALSEAVKGFDACVCGSDQIWNPNSYDTHYYLDFCSREIIRKVSYGASFGVSRIDDPHRRISAMLDDFSHLSVRETDGQRIVEKLTGRKDCSVVLDPTLMIPASIWKKMKDVYKARLPECYVACYFLGNTYIPHEWIKRVSEFLKCPVVNLTTFRTRNNIEGIQLGNLGPLEFLDVIDNASCVLTDSFHATVFSILFRKNFYTFDKHKKDSSVNENSRLYTLLQKLNLGNRHIEVNEVGCFSYQTIAYDNVKELLENERRHSLDFLIKSLAE